MSNDHAKGAKIPKPKTAEKVPVIGDKRDDEHEPEPATQRKPEDHEHDEHGALKAKVGDLAHQHEPEGDEGKKGEGDENPDFDPPKGKDKLTDKERDEAASEVPKPPEQPLAPAVPPTYIVRKGGHAYYRGQQIKFTDGETFTSETWEEHAVEGFRECGVTIERVA